MDPLLLPILTFGAVIAAVAAIYSVISDLYLRDRSRVKERIDEEFRKAQRERARRALVFKDANRLVLDGTEELEPALDMRGRLQVIVEQSGLNLTIEKLVTVSAAVGVGCGLLGGLLRQSVLVAVVAALAGALAPLGYVKYKRTVRLEKLLSQLPDTFDLMSRIVRAGQTLSQALQAVADEFAQPIAGELSYCYEQQNLGLSPEVAMRDLARRTGLLEVKIFVTAVIVQQQTGGSLAEMLDKLAHVIRQRYRTRGQIKTLTAEGRMQAMILLALPVVMFFGFLVLLPDYEGKLLEHPSLIVTTLTFELLGALWIRKIVNFDF
ncbi:MAG: type II secretion system F family protein [Isosphaeraceae bacterium]